MTYLKIDRQKNIGGASHYLQFCRQAKVAGTVVKKSDTPSETIRALPIQKVDIGEMDPDTYVFLVQQQSVNPAYCFNQEIRPFEDPHKKRIFTKTTPERINLVTKNELESAEELEEKLENKIDQIIINLGGAEPATTQFKEEYDKSRVYLEKARVKVVKDNSIYHEEGGYYGDKMVDDNEKNTYKLNKQKALKDNNLEQEYFDFCESFILHLIESARFNNESNDVIAKKIRDDNYWSSVAFGKYKDITANEVEELYSKVIEKFYTKVSMGNMSEDEIKIRFIG
ncbi:MAG: hypothetical protein QNJ31_08625 [Candidatus Caenarcaniphilales bacterium]|nr:hypothetical protein [Candidatus Caenarcaniphilales bacterium]